MTIPMKGLLKGLRYIARIFEDEKEPEMEIGKPTDVKHVAHIGWEGPSATTPSWMHEYKSPVAEAKGSSNKKSSEEKKRNKGRRKTSTGANSSPTESPSRVGGSTRTSKRSTGKQREQKEQSVGAGSEAGSGLQVAQQNDQSIGTKQSKPRKSKGSTTGGGGGGGETPPSAETAKEKDISVQAVYPYAGLGTSTGR